MLSAVRLMRQEFPRSIKSLTDRSQIRGIYWLLYAAGNKIDKERIKQVGPDKACAEWLLKCGARVRFHGRNNYISDYGQLGSAVSSKARLAEVDAEEATVMSLGFLHFHGVKDVEKLSFKRCPRFDDGCLEGLAMYISESVQTLEIVSCGDVTSRGLARLHGFKNLRSLHLFELPAVKEKKQAYESLVEHLPQCRITFEDQDVFYSSNSKPDE